MKHKIFLIALLFLAISFSKLHAESDTLWTTQIGSTVRTVKFSPDGQYVYAAADGRGPLKLDAKTGDILMEYEGVKFERPRVSKYCMQLSSDGKYLYSADNGKYIYKYDTESNELIDSIKISNEEKLNSFSWTLGLSKKYIFVFFGFSENNKILSRFNVINLETKEIVKSLNIADVTNIEVHENKNLVAISTAKDDNTEKAYVLIYDLEKLTLIHTFDQHTASITDLSFSPDGSLLASCDEYSNVKIWSIGNKEMLIGYKRNVRNTFSLALVNQNLITFGGGNFENFNITTSDLTNTNTISSYNLTYPLDFEYYKNILVVVSDFTGVICLKADRLTSVSSDFTKGIIYPNPATNLLTIPKTFFENNFISLSISDITGKTFYSNDTNQNEDLIIDVSNYPKGTYYINYYYKSGSQSTRFVKE